MSDLQSPDKKPGNIATIAKYFLEGLSAKEKMEAIKGLTEKDKEELVTGILDGSYTY